MRSRKGKIIAVMMLVVVVYLAIPKVYFHKLLGHDHRIEHKSASAHSIINKGESQDCDLDRYDAPLYFVIFKFIMNCNPFKSPQKVTYKEYQNKAIFFSKDLFSLRAPPKAV